MTAGQGEAEQRGASGRRDSVPATDARFRPNERRWRRLRAELERGDCRKSRGQRQGGWFHASSRLAERPEQGHPADWVLRPRLRRGARPREPVRHRAGRFDR